MASDLTGTLADAQMPDLTGDVTTVQGAVATTIGANKVLTTMIADANVTLAKMANLAADTFIGSIAGGVPAALTITAAGRALIDDAAASNQRTTLGLVAIAASGSASDLSTGTIPDARMPDLTGDVTTTEGAVATAIGTAKVLTTMIADSNVTMAKLATTEVDDGNSGASDTIDFSTGPNHLSTLTASTTFTFTLPANDGRVQLRLVQGGAGAFTVTWPGSVLWPAGSAPTVATATGTVHIITFFVDVSATKYYGVAALSFS